MAYEYGILETPEVDWESAQGNAARICRNWGYEGGATSLGGIIRECNYYGSYGCVRWLVTSVYQCRDSPAAPTES